ncbi:MAG: AraC family transcriptional regulator [Pseudomonadota bacterium]
MRTWRVDGPAGPQRERRWSDGLAEAFVRLDATYPSDNTFAGSIRQAKVGSLAVARVDAAAHRVRRRRAHIRAESPDVCFVNIQRSGVGRVCQAGSDAIARPMDVAVVDTAEPFSIDHRQAFSLYSVTVDRQAVPALLREKGVLSLSKTATGRELAGVLGGLAGLMTRAGAVGGLAGHFLSLLASAPDLLEPEAEPWKSHSAQLDLFLAYIERNLATETLGAAALARHFGLSPRRVHQVFEPSGCTVSDTINARRLARAASLLICDSQADASIGTIAYAVGYRDLSYFNRRFRRAYGMTPTEYRARR